MEERKSSRSSEVNSVSCTQHLPHVIIFNRHTHLRLKKSFQQAIVLKKSRTYFGPTTVTACSDTH